MTDIRQSANYASYLKSQGWIVERIKNINYFIKSLTFKIPFIKKTILVGSFLKVQRSLKVDLKTIKKIENKYRVFQTIVEPNLASVVNSLSDIHSLLLHKGFKVSKSPFLPTKTIHVDLKRSKEDIFRSFTKECRYSIRKGESLKIKEYNSPEKIKIFREVWKNSVNFSRYVPSLKSLLSLRRSFPQSYSTFLASHNKVGRIIGGAIFTRSSHGFGYYWYGFTKKEGRTSLSQYALLYSGILWAKKHGCKTFDLEGIHDERFPNKSWLGFTHFKKQFGGTEISYLGSYTKFKLPFNFTKH